MSGKFLPFPNLFVALCGLATRYTPIFFVFA